MRRSGKGDGVIPSWRPKNIQHQLTEARIANDMYEDKVLKCRDENFLQQANRSFMQKRVFRMNPQRDANHAAMQKEQTAENAERALFYNRMLIMKEASAPLSHNDRPVYCSEALARKHSLSQ